VNSSRTAFGPAPVVFPASLDAVIKAPRPPRAPKVKTPKLPKTPQAAKPRKLPRGRATFPMLPPST
jgi:hypothetical protein